MSKPASYREQSACANCEHIRLWTADHPYVCGRESNVMRHENVARKEVRLNGICDNYKREEGKEQ